MNPVRSASALFVFMVGGHVAWADTAYFQKYAPTPPNGTWTNQVTPWSVTASNQSKTITGPLTGGVYRLYSESSVGVPGMLPRLIMNFAPGAGQQTIELVVSNSQFDNSAFNDLQLNGVGGTTWNGLELGTVAPYVLLKARISGDLVGNLTGQTETSVLWVPVFCSRLDIGGSIGGGTTSLAGWGGSPASRLNCGSIIASSGVQFRRGELDLGVNLLNNFVVWPYGAAPLRRTR